ncbi:MAG: hypothetical protein GC164_01670 [Phycisphaera sp.]|nr:hypothetical protein [Phycisphaera sp.]
MRTVVQPALADWPRSARAGKPLEEIAPFLTGPVLNQNKPVIATGHQAWLWHPGILAKYLAAHAAAGQTGASILNIIVDTDAHDATKLDVPVVEGDRLTSKTLRLGDGDPRVPTGMQPGVDPNHVYGLLLRESERLTEGVAQGLNRIAWAYKGMGQTRTLADQLWGVQTRLMTEYVPGVTHLKAGDILKTPAGLSVVRAMLNDARQCAQRYNGAVHSHPRAGVGALAVEPDRVELPLWMLEWNGPRQRVFADLADSVPLLTLADGTPIREDDPRLAPKAMLLTALVRGFYCDVFIHGTGGGIYDPATEAWWRDWRGGALAPMAVVTADLTLDFDVPLATPRDYEKALWRRHHLPHNLDRDLQLNSHAVRRKRELLAHMDDDRDRPRRQAAFRELHRINEEWVSQNPGALEEAQREVVRAELGLSNAGTAGRRDWCWALYPPKRIGELSMRLRESVPSR